VFNNDIKMLGMQRDEAQTELSQVQQSIVALESQVDEARAEQVCIV
jgi:hypothetical protein